MDNVNQMVIRTSLRNMFARGLVDICAIDKCLKLSGITPIGATYQQLHALHCIYFKDMDRDLAAMVPNMVAELFDGLQLSAGDIFDKDPTKGSRTVDITPAPKGNAFLRLIGVN